MAPWAAMVLMEMSKSKLYINVLNEQLHSKSQKWHPLEHIPRHRPKVFLHHIWVIIWICNKVYKPEELSIINMSNTSNPSEIHWKIGKNIKKYTLLQCSGEYEKKFLDLHQSLMGLLWPVPHPSKRFGANQSSTFLCSPEQHIPTNQHRTGWKPPWQRS